MTRNLSVACRSRSGQFALYRFGSGDMVRPTICTRMELSLTDRNLVWASGSDFGRSMIRRTQTPRSEAPQQSDSPWPSALDHRAGFRSRRGLGRAPRTCLLILSRPGYSSVSLHACTVAQEKGAPCPSFHAVGDGQWPQPCRVERRQPRHTLSRRLVR